MKARLQHVSPRFSAGPRPAQPNGGPMIEMSAGPSATVAHLMPGSLPLPLNGDDGSLGGESGRKSEKGPVKDDWPPFIMLKKLDITLMEIYDEWYHGLNGNPSVKSLNEQGEQSMIAWKLAYCSC
jgi:hypothetical protein